MHHKCPSKGRSQYFSLNLSITDLSSTQTHFYSTTKACVQIDGISLPASHVSPLPISHMDVLTFKTYKNIHFQNFFTFWNLQNIEKDANTLALWLPRRPFFETDVILEF